jgi:hypothetical protein
MREKTDAPDLRERITDLLDVLGLLAVAAGVGGGLWPRIGWWALVVAGALLLVGVQVAEMVGRPRREPEPPARPRAGSYLNGQLVEPGKPVPAAPGTAFR